MGARPRRSSVRKLGNAPATNAGMEAVDPQLRRSQFERREDTTAADSTCGISKGALAAGFAASTEAGARAAAGVGADVDAGVGVGADVGVGVGADSGFAASTEADAGAAAGAASGVGVGVGSTVALASADGAPVFSATTCVGD